MQKKQAEKLLTLSSIKVFQCNNVEQKSIILLKDLKKTVLLIFNCYTSKFCFSKLPLEVKEMILANMLIVLNELVEPQFDQKKRYYTVKV